MNSDLNQDHYFLIDSKTQGPNGYGTFPVCMVYGSVAIIVMKQKLLQTIR